MPEPRRTCLGEWKVSHQGFKMESSKRIRQLLFGLSSTTTLSSLLNPAFEPKPTRSPTKPHLNPASTLNPLSPKAGLQGHHRHVVQDVPRQRGGDGNEDEQADGHVRRRQQPVLSAPFLLLLFFGFLVFFMFFLVFSLGGGGGDL